MAHDRGPRRKLATNIFEDTIGRVGIARAAGRTRELRFSTRTTVAKIAKALDAERGKLRAASTRRRRVLRDGGQTAGTLSADVAAYLETLPDGPRRRDATALLAPWVVALGHRQRATVTAADLRLVVAGWTVAASTVNHRRRALAAVWEAHDGEEAENPVRRVKRAKETLGEPRAWPVPVLDRIIAGVGPDRARAQLHLLLWTGMPPGSLARLPMGDVDLEAWTIRYPARRKGAGAQPVLLPIVPAGRARVRAWLRAFAWGGVDGVNLTRRLRVATARYRMAHPDCPVPADVQLYDLRDSFLTWLYAETGDPLLVQLYGQHADLATTYRYIRGGVPARAAAAIAAMAATEVLPRFAATVLTTAGDETGRRLTNGPSGGRGGFPRKA